MLGYAELEWLSVNTQEMPPRKPLEPLAGGYKRIPVAQIGADVFCDSNIIADEIAKLAEKPELSLRGVSQEVIDFTHKTQGQIFFACVLAGGSAKLRKKLRESMGLWDIARFMVDRINMGRKATSEIVSIRKAKPLALEFIEQCEEMLTGQSFLFGEKPNIGDFSAYHCLWFIRDLGEHQYINNYPQLIAWMDKMRSFAVAPKREISPQEALEIAKLSDASAIPEKHKQSKHIGKIVNISPSDYRQNPTSGKLVGDDQNTWILERANAEIGIVHTHFPQHGYQLKVKSR